MFVVWIYLVFWLCFLLLRYLIKKYLCKIFIMKEKDLIFLNMNKMCFKIEIENIFCY